MYLVEEGTWGGACFSAVLSGALQTHDRGNAGIDPLCWPIVVKPDGFLEVDGEAKSYTFTTTQTDTHTRPQRDTALIAEAMC